MTVLEKNIQYTFNSEGFRETALSHSSYIYEKKMQAVSSNERLEFLGDAVLELVVTKYLYDTYPDLPEGQLTKLRASVVCEPMLAKTAKRLSLGDFIKLGKGEDQVGGRERASTLSDLFEAVIGAIYLDGGFDCAKEFILRELEHEIVHMRTHFNQNDAKTYLQELLQKNGPVNIEYKIVSETGPEHNKLFSVTVSFNGDVLGKGEGRSKKESEQNAAADALAFLQVNDEILKV